MRKNRIISEDVLKKHLSKFLEYSKDHLKLNSIPKVNLEDSKPQTTSFGSYSPANKEIVVNTFKRHPADVLRTLAHELKHHKQNEEGMLNDVISAGETGSTFENEANSEAGVIMRNYGRSNPDIYESKTLGKFLSSLNEVLDDEQRKQVDTWSKPKAGHKFSDHVFGDQHRVHVPLEFPDHKSEHQEKIEAHLEPHGIKVHDYVGGFGTDKHGRQVSIGKALVKTKADSSLINGFANDPKRQQLKAMKDIRMVVSRHPHDVAGMTSSGQSWENQSCMNFSRGGYREYLRQDVKHGTHVAYLIHKDDHNIEKPMARIALKPFQNVLSRKKDLILRPENRTYGDAPDAFSHTVNLWVNKHFPGKEDGIYKKHHALYDDTHNDPIIGSKAGDKLIKKLFAPKDTMSPEEEEMAHNVITGKNLSGKNRDFLASNFHKSTNHSDRIIRALVKRNDLSESNIDSLLENTKNLESEHTAKMRRSLHHSIGETPSKLHDKHITELIKRGNGEDGSYILGDLVGRDDVHSFSDSHIHQLLSSHKVNDSAGLMDRLMWKIGKNHVDEFINPEGKYHQSMNNLGRVHSLLANNQNLNSHHIHGILDHAHKTFDKNDYFSTIAPLVFPNRNRDNAKEFNQSHVDKVIHQAETSKASPIELEDFHRKMISRPHPDTNLSWMDHVLDKGSPYARWDLVRQRNDLPAHAIDKVVHDEDTDIVNLLHHQDNLNSEHVSKILKKELVTPGRQHGRSVREEYINNNLVSNLIREKPHLLNKEHVTHILSHGNATVRTELLSSDNVPIHNDHIESLLKGAEKTKNGRDFIDLRQRHEKISYTPEQKERIGKIFEQ